MLAQEHLLQHYHKWKARLFKVRFSTSVSQFGISPVAPEWGCSLHSFHNILCESGVEKADER